MTFTAIAGAAASGPDVSCPPTSRRLASRTTDSSEAPASHGLLPGAEPHKPGRMMKRTRYLWLAVLAVACGGSTQPADAPSEEPRPAGEELGESEPTDEADEEETAGADRASGADEQELDDEELGKVLQVAINDEEITPRLRLGEPGRFPMKMSGEALPSGVELVKLNEPVVIVDAAEEGQAVFEVTDIETSRERVVVRFVYAAEGIKGAITLEKAPSGWVVARTRVVER